MHILNADCPSAAAEASEILKKPGTVLLVPTETVYGLVCSWQDPAGRARIYELKHRAENKPFAAFVSDTDQLPQNVLPVPAAAKILARKFCPGPVTLVIPDHQNSTFGFRIPDHPFIQQLLKIYGGALASTSANLSGKPAALCVDDALQSIDGEPAMAIDGGPLSKESKASTVIQVFADNTWKILREGPVSRQQIELALAEKIQ